jgi:hypothetical protein
VCRGWETDAVYGPLVQRVRPDPSPGELAAAINDAVGPPGRNRAAIAREMAWNHHSAARMATMWASFLHDATVSVSGAVPSRQDDIAQIRIDELLSR